MIYVDWQLGTSVEPPVYVDANVFVGATIRSHRLYLSCASFIGDLLANRWPLLVSTLSIQESLWALVRLSYCELVARHPAAHFSQKIYKKWCGRIFQQHGTRIAAVGSMLRDLAKAGLPVEVVPTQEKVWTVLDLVPTYMRRCNLTPADAFHLALAETYARTFITADSDFKTVPQTLVTGDLVILHLAGA